MTVRRALLLFALILYNWISGCSEESTLRSSRCLEPCFEASPKHEGVGLCRAGRPICEDGKFLRCEGQILPSRELCDGLDNDCDGMIDDYASGQDIGKACVLEGTGPLYYGPLSTCKKGRVKCIDGVVTCSGFVGPQAQEVCDGIDNDCNGAIDDNIALVSTCYPGNVEDLRGAHSACRAGVEICEQGIFICSGAVLPKPEVCDGKDTDCNGVVDDVPPETDPQPIDMVLAIDRSCSMALQLQRVQVALIDFIEAHRTPTYRYAVVSVPSQLDTSLAYELSLNLAPAQDALLYISGLGTGNGGTEPSYDALLAIANGDARIFWRTGSYRIVFWFGDEQAQSIRMPPVTELEVALALRKAEIVFYGFTQVDVRDDYRDHYDDLALLTNGEVFALDDLNRLRQIFLDTIRPPCRR